MIFLGPSFVEPVPDYSHLYVNSNILLLKIQSVREHRHGVEVACHAKETEKLLRMAVQISFILAWPTLILFDARESAFHFADYNVWVCDNLPFCSCAVPS